MLRKLMEKNGKIEVFFRWLASVLQPVKKFLKRKMNKSKIVQVTGPSEEKELIFRNQLRLCNIMPDDIVIIHSSIDGLQGLGLEAKAIVDIILDEYKDATVVFAAYPIEPKIKKEVYKYNPKKTVCWTGMLPNAFMLHEGVIRTAYPYNSLAAYGKLAEEMTKDNLLSKYPHGKNSAWDYCYKHHAKILFVGTTSREANTMAIHMVPDVMEDTWPIDNWYETREYAIQLDKETVNKTAYIQKGSWYRFVNEYRTDYLLKENGYLKDISEEGLIFEYVPDSYDMMQYLIKNCEEGKLMYSIPKKYYKK